MKENNAEGLFFFAQMIIIFWILTLKAEKIFLKQRNNLLMALI